jgi:hypothetical protein
VARYVEIARSQRTGCCRKAAGVIRTAVPPSHSACSMVPSPMSWNIGSHETTTSSCPWPKLAFTAARFAIRFPC